MAQKAQVEPFVDPINVGPDVTVYKIGPSLSKVTWVGRRLSDQHDGELPIVRGELYMDSNGRPVGGYGIVDMTGITNSDIEDPVRKQRFLRMLESEAFFDTRRYPAARLVIVHITADDRIPDRYLVEGKLTIRNISRRVSFQADLLKKKNGYNARGRMRFGRSKWRLGTFSPNKADKLSPDEIFDEIEVGLDIFFTR